jgi:hypothetical protein
MSALEIKISSATVCVLFSPQGATDLPLKPAPFFFLTPPGAFSSPPLFTLHPTYIPDFFPPSISYPFPDFPRSIQFVAASPLSSQPSCPESRVAPPGTDRCLHRLLEARSITVGRHDRAVSVKGKAGLTAPPRQVRAGGCRTNCNKGLGRVVRLRAGSRRAGATHSIVPPCRSEEDSKGRQGVVLRRVSSSEECPRCAARASARWA